MFKNQAKKIRVDISALENSSGVVMVCDKASDEQMHDYLQVLPVEVLESITHASFGDSEIGDKSVKFLLLRCPKLLCLNLTNTLITKALNEFLATLAGTYALEELDLSYTCYAEEAADQLENIFRKENFPKLSIYIAQPAPELSEEDTAPSPR